jgi:hypothetical protein
MGMQIDESGYQRVLGQFDVLPGAEFGVGLSARQDCNDTPLVDDDGVSGEHAARRFDRYHPACFDDGVDRPDGWVHGYSIQKKALPKQGFFQS